MTTRLFYSGEEATFREFALQCHADKFILLADANTNGFCVPVFKELFPFLKSAPLIVIPQGESNKSIDVCSLIWDQLVNYQSTRHTVLINIGGGMLSDIGGFAASVYKRGIQFINIPTTLLSMVDACYGGKTGIDYHQTKNLLGSFQSPLAVFCNPFFLQTLNQRILVSGIAEMIKHALLSSPAAWQEIQKSGIEECCSIESIKHSLEVKKVFADQDIFDQGSRQALNLGHTIGHSIESYALQSATPLLHGEAVMLGLIHELKLSHELFQLPENIISELIEIKKRFYPNLNYEYSFENIEPFLLHDKKNYQGIRMSLLRDIGKVELQALVSISQIQHSFL